MTRHLLNKLILPGILLLTVSIFVPHLHNDFVNLDDAFFVVNNEHIRGLSLAHFRAIFTEKEVLHYNPVTSLVYAAEYRLFGLDARGFHAVSLLLHLVNICLVYLLVRRLFKGTLTTAFTTLLFAIHPMHVEPVAWIAATSTLVYGSFFLCAVYVYIPYARQKKTSGYWLSLLLFAAALLSKVAAVTLPLVLLIIDLFYYRQDFKKMILEKVPFFALALATGMIALAIAKAGGTTGVAIGDYSLLQQIGLIAYTKATYLIGAIVPFRLCALHLKPVIQDGQLPWIYYLAILPLAGLAVALLVVIRKGRLASVYSFGFFFFIATISVFLKPVGIVTTCDRYTYLPYIGLFLIAAGILSNFYRHGSSRRILAVALIVALACAYTAQSFLRLYDWKDSQALWTDITVKYPDHYYGHHGLGLAYLNSQPTVAFTHFSNAIERNPDYMPPRYMRGIASMNTGDYFTALKDFNVVMEQDTSYLDELLLNRARARALTLDTSGAMQDYSRLINRFTAQADALNERGLLYASQQAHARAIADYSASLQYAPKAETYRNRGHAHYSSGYDEPALADYSMAIKLNPSDDKAYYSRGVILHNQSRRGEACVNFRKAAELGHLAAGKVVEVNCR